MASSHTAGTAIRDEIGVSMGAADQARRNAAGVRKDIEFLSETIVIMERQIQRLQTDVREMKGEP